MLVASADVPHNQVLHLAGGKVAVKGSLGLPGPQILDICLPFNLPSLFPPSNCLQPFDGRAKCRWGYLLELICFGCICTFVHLFPIWAVTFIDTNVLWKANLGRNVNIRSEEQPDPNSETCLPTLSTWMCLIDFVEWNLILGTEAMPWAFADQLRQIAHCSAWVKIVQDLTSLYWIRRDKTHARGLDTLGESIALSWPHRKRQRCWYE